MTRAHDLGSGSSRARLRLPRDARASLRIDGHFDIADLWEHDVAASLHDEARDLWHAGLIGDAAHGPALAELHHHLAGLTRALTGQVLVPTVARYTFFERDEPVELDDGRVDDPLTLATAIIGSTDYPCHGVRAYRDHPIPPHRPTRAVRVFGAIAVMHYGPPR